MKKKIETIKTGIKDILLELEYSKDTTGVWVTREEFGIKIFIWGIPKAYEMTKKEIIETSINELLNNFLYYKDILEL